MNKSTLTITIVLIVFTIIYFMAQLTPPDIFFVKPPLGMI